MLTTVRRATTAPARRPKTQPQATAPRRQRRRGSDAPATPRANGWTTGTAHSAGAARVLILLALVSGPVALGLVAHNGAQPVAPAAVIASTQPDPGQVSAVGNFASEFVTAWLTTSAGGEAALGFYLQSTSGLRLPTEAARIQNVAVADVEHVQDYAAAAVPDAPTASSTTTAGASTPTTPLSQEEDDPSSTWQVTVAADVEEANADGAPVMVRRYYAVPVLLRQPTRAAGERAAGVVQKGPQTSTQPDARQMRALLLPQPVAGPAAAEGAELVYTQQVGPNASLTSSVSQFLAAYTAGTGDVTRYVSPGETLTPITPAPYASVQIQSVLAREDDPTSDEPSDGQQVQVLVTALLADRNQQQSSTQRVLDLTARGGRWEVSGIAPAPALDLPAAVGAASAATGGSVAVQSPSTFTTSTPATSTPTSSSAQ